MNNMQNFMKYFWNIVLALKTKKNIVWFFDCNAQKRKSKGLVIVNIILQILQNPEIVC